MSRRATAAIFVVAFLFTLSVTGRAEAVVSPPQPPIDDVVRASDGSPQFVVTTQGPAAQALAAALAAADTLRGQGLREVRQLGDAVVTFAGDPARARSALATVGIPASVSPDYARKLAFVPNDGGYPSQWNLNGAYGAYTSVNAPSAWTITHGSPSVVVADIDTGVDGTHPDLVGKLVQGYNATSNTLLAPGNTDSPEGHGTAVIGTIGSATNNNGSPPGYSGDLASLGWDTKLMPIKADARDAAGKVVIPDSSAIAGLRWAADNGARVANLSFAGPGWDQGLGDAVGYAQSKGVLVVAAMGNDYAAGNPVEYPAAFPGVLAVGATGHTGARAYYSNTGSHIGLVAPGGSVDGNPAHDIPVLKSGTAFTVGGTTTMAGTSFASPQAAAAAALVLAVNPSLTADRVAALLKRTAHDLGPPGFDAEYGAGILDAAAAVAGANSAGPAWQPYVGLGAPPGGFTSGPDVASWAPGRLDVFARGSDNALWHNWFDGAWHSWESLGGVLAGDPTAVSWSAGRIDVFVRGTDNGMWHKWFDGAWRGYEWLGSPPGGLTSGPDAASWAPGRLDVFTRGTDGGLWHTWYDGGWRVWESFGGALNGDPTAVSWSAGRLDVFVRGTDNNLWHLWYDGAWRGYEGLGSPPGGLTSGPDVSSWGPGRLDVFARGNDGGLWQETWSGSWSAWGGLGGALTSDPGAVSWGRSRIDVFVRGTDNTIFQRTYN